MSGCLCAVSLRSRSSAISATKNRDFDAARSAVAAQMSQRSVLLSLSLLHMDDVQSDAEGRAPLLDIDLADEPASQQPGLSNVELAALCWARCVHTWVFYAVFPFLPDLLHRIGIDEGELGYYAGLVESSYSLAQFLAMSSWATFADRFDRKQVLCVCLLGQMTAALLFGFSCHVWQMLACRTIGGLFSASAL